MPAWPGSLPQVPLLGTYSEAPKTNLVVSSMDYGPSKRRRRTTASIKEAKFMMRMTSSQFDTFETFFEDTLGDGAESFDWTHPRSGNAVVCYMNGYSVTDETDLYYMVEIELEYLPS